MSTAHTAVVVGVGAEDGLGATVSRRLAKEGLHVFVAGRTPEKLDTVVATITGAGGAATAVATDTTREADVTRLFDRAEQDGPGALDCVVYNAGNNRITPLLETGAQEFEDVWRVTCFGGFLVAREAARRMTPRGAGTFIFTGATSAVKGRPPFAAFASAKGGLRLLAQAMAREFGPQGLHVAFVIIDGAINGERIHSRYPQVKEMLGEDGMLNLEAIADAYWHIYTQHKTAWTHELDLRPFKESW